MEFNTKTRTGTFYNRDRNRDSCGEAGAAEHFGAQEPDAFFWGDELQKIGPKKYRIVHGGFTTCVQPTPRWDVRSGSITLNLDDYVLLKNAVFRVKGVPLMFLPIFYYPIQEDDRATGFLMPIYGSTTRGTDAQQPVLLGDQPEPGRHDRARLVLEDRTADGRRVPVRARAGAKETRSCRC